ncbi:hypothetical protein VTJ04DRAFT_2977 [Mycothermus thermophilus]|uniref:uncharacterized protein n=1 Tax=Humicola insolens TaxID=85995 RepID=UPI003742625D
MENSKRDAAAQADLPSPADAEVLKPSQNQGHARPEGNEASGIPPQQDHFHPPQTGTSSQFPLTVNTEAQTQLATEMAQVPLSRPVVSVNGQTLSQSAQWPAYNGGLNQPLPGMEADERINAICQHTQHSGEGGMGLPSQVQWVVPPQVGSHEYHDLNVSAYDVGCLEQPQLESMEEFIRRIEAEAMLAGTETGMTEEPLEFGTRFGMLGAGELEQDETTFREFYPFSEMPRAGFTTRSAQNLDVDLLPPPRLTSVGDPIQQRSWDLGLSPRDSPQGQGRYEFDRRIGGRTGLWEL